MILNTKISIRNMAVQGLTIILYTEIIRNLIGFILLGYEITKLDLIKADKNRINLFFILIFHNMMYLLRAVGIYSNNSTLRQLGPALSALLSSILILTWTAEIIGYNKRYKTISLAVLILAIVFFGVGRFFKLQTIELIGILILIFEISFLIFDMFRFVFRASPYIRARQRIFLMAMAFVLMSIFEGSGVIMMSDEQFGKGSTFFLLELLARVLITLSIVLPLRLQNYLMTFIK